MDFGPLVDGLLALVFKPATHELKERRKRARVRCDFPVRVQCESDYLQARVTNLGVDGLLLRSGRALPRHAELKIVYQHQDSYEQLSSVRGKVAWCRRDPRLGGYMMGVRYEYTQKDWVSFVLDLLGLDDESVFQRRRYMRAEAVLPARLGVPGKMAPQKGWVLNLGLGGALVEMPVTVGNDNPVTLTLGPLDGLQPLVLKGRVLETRASGDELNFLIGLEFSLADPAQERALGRYILAALKNAAKPA